MTTRCREGHESTEPDYCSVCGAAMRTPAARGKGPAKVSSPATVCPSCGEARADTDARYCEVCRFDFVAKQAGPPPAGQRQPTAAPNPLAALVNAPRASWELVVRVDPSLDTEPDPTSPCPSGVAELVITLDRELLVGRRDDLRDIRPELPVSDPGASRRHAKFVLGADGLPALQDLASTNGTKLNGADTAPGSRTPLKDGDSVTLGRWTRITLRARP